jgi:hypothetical protein
VMRKYIKKPILRSRPMKTATVDYVTRDHVWSQSETMIFWDRGIWEIPMIKFSAPPSRLCEIRRKMDAYCAYFNVHCFRYYDNVFVKIW